MQSFKRERHGINLQTFPVQKRDWKHGDEKPSRVLVKIETPKAERIASISIQFNG
ncbi:hypothetical protein [Aliiglaciecola lipolytica]|uniref:hypothetical protein n=1 Tax=Aliiglaciecola lipolytica TaxID=477689 RepID=UPI00129C2092|nr:hypothetical protein [Aliiglaciecola lipolytica]